MKYKQGGHILSEWIESIIDNVEQQTTEKIGIVSSSAIPNFENFSIESIEYAWCCHLLEFRRTTTEQILYCYSKLHK